MPEPQIGDLRVWHIPQIPGKPFIVPVSTVEEGRKVMKILGQYDLFQYENNIKPDYANANGLERYEALPKFDEDGLEDPDWYDVEEED